MSDWIPVAERLPIEADDMQDLNYREVDVIVHTKNNNVFPAIFKAGNTLGFWSKFDGFYDETVIHWKPMPAPPGEDA